MLDLVSSLTFQTAFGAKPLAFISRPFHFYLPFLNTPALIIISTKLQILSVPPTYNTILLLKPQLVQPLLPITSHLKLCPWVTQLNKHGIEEGLPILQVAAPSLALPTPAADVTSPNWALFD